MSKHERLKELAHLRVQTQWRGYRRPEDYWGYDFRDLVSPYSRTAGNVDANVMLFLQDWSPHDKLMNQGYNRDVARYGHDPSLKTNLNLKDLLRQHLGLELEETYGTNLFPFIKAGGISATIPMRDFVRAAEMFALPQIEIVNPRVVLALGRHTADALKRVGVQVVPYPAARLRNAPKQSTSVLELPHPVARPNNVPKATVDEAWRAVRSFLSS
ncbi:MAG: hypothetical protein EXR50_06560 [Dehalococcoidia bacterium]|nr:hypothetical protein [Dehalococcoidia bacterium]